MPDFTYTPTPTKIKKYFDKIQEVKVPTNKVNMNYLKSIGFKSGNDWYFIKILKFLGFIDTSNKPTNRWTEYRVKTKSKEVMATALRASYASLFKTYEDAFRKDKEALYDFFSSRSKLGESTIQLMVKTFQELCKLADFEKASISIAPSVADQAVGIKPTQEVVAPSIPSININIELHLPATNDPTVYEELFKAMKKHLLS